MSEALHVIHLPMYVCVLHEMDKNVANRLIITIILIALFFILKVLTVSVNR
jgi:hypothetical protein